MHRKWGKQVKFFEDTFKEPFSRHFSDTVSCGLSLLEIRAPTRMGVTVPETDLASDSGCLHRLMELGREHGVELAYHAPQGEEWNFGKLPFKTALKQLHICVDRAATLGAKYMTLHLGIDVTVSRIKSIRRGATVLQTAAAYALERGVLLCVENVFDNHSSVAYPEECLELFKIADSDQIRFTLDTGHANIYGCLFEMLDVVRQRLAFTHVHDNDGEKDLHLVPGHGTIDWIRFLQRLEQYGYTGPMNFELREECSFLETIAWLEGPCH